MKLLIMSMILFVTLSTALAEELKPFLDLAKIDHFLQMTRLDSYVLAGVCCFIAGAISSAGGIGGGGLFIPILAIVAGLDLKTSSTFTAFMVTGVSVANVLYTIFISIPKSNGKTLIDLDISLICLPGMLLGVSIGIICNIVFPEWLITVLFAVFLAWSTFKTFKKGFSNWKKESEKVKGSSGQNQPLLVSQAQNNETLGFAWVKLAVLVIVWLSFFAIYFLRGNGDGKGIVPMEPCGVVYWILSSLQIPLAILFTIWFIYTQDIHTIQDTEDLTTSRSPNKLFFPLMAFLAGVLSGFFGIGGGLLISPLFLQFGIDPEVTAATTSFMVFFSTTMMSIQYLLLGVEQIKIVLTFTLICFVASILGLVVIQKAVKMSGRPSIIIFSVAVAMALSTVLMTSYGTIDVWKEYVSGNYMGFKLPC